MKIESTSRIGVPGLAIDVDVDADADADADAEADAGILFDVDVDVAVAVAVVDFFFFKGGPSSDPWNARAGFEPMTSQDLFKLYLISIFCSILTMIEPIFDE